MMRKVDFDMLAVPPPVIVIVAVGVDPLTEPPLIIISVTLLIL